MFILLLAVRNRIGLAKGEDVLEVENNYLKIIPNWAMKDAMIGLFFMEDRFVKRETLNVMYLK